VSSFSGLTGEWLAGHSLLVWGLFRVGKRAEVVGSVGIAIFDALSGGTYLKNEKVGLKYMKYGIRGIAMW
jgi:hypothetical protein